MLVCQAHQRLHVGTVLGEYHQLGPDLEHTGVVAVKITRGERVVYLALETALCKGLFECIHTISLIVLCMYWQACT